MASAVTTKIKEILKARDARILSGEQAVSGLLREVQRLIVMELASAPAESFAAYRLQQSLVSIEKHLADFESAAKRELGDGLGDTWKMGTELLPAAGRAAEMTIGNFWVSTNTLDALKEFTWGRIAAVTSDAYNRIRGEVTMGILGQKTPQAVASAVAGNLESPSLFKSIAERAEVITGTEMGRAFSLATEKSIDAAQEMVPGLTRMWLHAGHPKMPRQMHLAMHGQVRPVGKPFYQTPAGAKVFFPRDPQAPIKEIIRCGCTHVPYHPDWGDEKSFAADFDAKQYTANFKKAA